MELKSKTYNIPEGRLDFEFHYDGGLTGMSDFDIIDLSPLSYGYDSADPKEISIYPSNISIVIDDFSGDNYKSFKSLYASYNSTYPFNFYEIFFLEIKLNGVVIYKGIIDELESDNENKTLTLTFVDGINKYKEVEIFNPYLLYHFNSIGLIPGDHALGGHASAFGFSNIYPSWNPRGFFVEGIEGSNADRRLGSEIIGLCRALRGDMIVEFMNDYKYGDFDTAIEDMVTIDQLNVRRLMSNLFGRYVVIKKLLGMSRIVADDNSPEYAKPQYFKIVYEDAATIVFYHDWSGHVGSLKYEKGIEEKKYQTS